MTLAEILDPVTLARFLTHHLGTRPLHAAGPPGRFASLDPATPPRPGHPWDAATLLARDIEHATDATVHREPDQAPTAGSHRATQDRLILQLHDTSRLTLWDPTLEQPGGDPLIIDLHPGHAAYVPYGWWLSDTAADTASPGTRCTFAIAPPTGRDLLAWLVRQLDRHGFYAAPLPCHAPPAVQADYLTNFRRAVAGACRTPGLLALHTAYRNGHAAPRTPLAAPAPTPLGPDHVIDYLAARHLRLWRADEDTLSFKFDGRDLRFPLDAAQLLSFLEHRTPATVGAFQAAFADAFDADELIDFLHRLADEGMVALLPAS